DHKRKNSDRPHRYCSAFPSQRPKRGQQRPSGCRVAHDFGGATMSGGTLSEKIGFDRARFIRPVASIAVLALAAFASTPRSALADEGGVSFWLPGFFGSLAAAPQQPGWSLTSIY